MEFKVKWVNRGVGRALRDYRLEVRLTNAAGDVVESSNAGAVATSTWVKGCSYDVTAPCRFAQVPAGDYELRLVLVDPLTDEPIHLPLTQRLDDGSCLIGSITVR
jgi:hypothetical protein